MQTKILYEDKDLFVIHKLSGIAVQSARIGQMDVESELKNHLAKKGEKPFVALVHRLDQPVEGLLVVAKNPKTAAELNKQLSDGILNKTYLAVVAINDNNTDMSQSQLEEADCGFFKDYMLKDGQVAKIVSPDTKEAKEAKLHYYIIKKKDNLALVKVEIETGRFHQIRCQMAHHNMPLLGDTKYGTEASLYISRNYGVRNVALCANEIAFVHPVTKKEMNYSVGPMNLAFTKIS